MSSTGNKISHRTLSLPCITYTLSNIALQSHFPDGISRVLLPRADLVLRSRRLAEEHLLALRRELQHVLAVGLAPPEEVPPAGADPGKIAPGACQEGRSGHTLIYISELDSEYRNLAYTSEIVTLAS